MFTMANAMICNGSATDCCAAQRGEVWSENGETWVVWGGGYSTCRQFCVQEGPQIIHSLSFCNNINNSGKFGTKSNAWSLNSRRNSTNLQMTGQMLKWSLTALWFSCAVRRRLNWSGHWRLCCLHKVTCSTRLGRFTEVEALDCFLV